ncbi:MAG: hypothetical protein ACE5EV_07255 [Gaiellales bacterium]
MSPIALVLLVAAVVLVVAAEWPRLSERVGANGIARIRRERRRARFTVIEGSASDHPEEDVADDVDEFAASVQRDLERLPTTDDVDR